MVDSATPAQCDMTSKQFIEDKARQRENDMAMLAIAKKQEANRKCEIVRIDKRTIIMQPIDAKNRKSNQTAESHDADVVVTEYVPTRLITDLSADEIAQMEREYPNEANRDLAIKYGVSISQIQQYACKHKIHKSNGFRSVRARQHALVGRRKAQKKYGKD